MSAKHCLAVMFALGLSACVTESGGVAQRVTIIACPGVDGAAFFVDNRKVAKPSVVAAVKSSVGETSGSAVIAGDPQVNYGDVSDVALRLRAAGFAPVDVIAFEPGDSPCPRLMR